MAAQSEAASGSRFKSLLWQLQEEHRRELSLLSTENERLRASAGDKTPHDGGGQSNGNLNGLEPSAVQLDCISDPPSGGSRHHWNLGLSPFRALSQMCNAQRGAPGAGMVAAIETQTTTASEDALPMGVVNCGGGPGASAQGPPQLVSNDGAAASAGKQEPDASLAMGHAVSAWKSFSEMSQNGWDRRDMKKRTVFTPRSEWKHDYINTDDGPLAKGWNTGQHSFVSQSQIFSDPLKGLCLINPTAQWRMCWDISGLLLLTYDSVMIPFTMAFQPRPGWFLATMDAITLLFWTLDMCQGFFLSSFQQGVLITDPRTVRALYCKKWFVPDLIINGLEWMLLALKLGGLESSSGEIVGLARLFRGLRAMRVMRLIRLTKLKAVIHSIYDRIDSEYTFVMVGLVKLLTIVIIMNHVLACIWFAIGRFSGEPNWISNIAAIHGEPQSLGRIWWKYTTALHWSLTQFTPAGMELRPYNVYERMFSILTVFLAMIAFSSVVGSITSSITEMRNIQSENTKDFWLLRRYLKQQGVHKDDSTRMIKFLEHQVEQRTNRVSVERVAILKYLSEPLQDLLTLTMRRKQIEYHPFFELILSEKTKLDFVMFTLCRKTLQVESYAAQDQVFEAGSAGTSMYFFVGDFSNLSQGDRQTSVLRYEKEHSVNVPPFSWVAEASVWAANWRHLGGLKAVIPCELVGLQPQPFAEAMHLHVVSWNYAKTYGLLYLKWLNKQWLLDDNNIELSPFPEPTAVVDSGERVSSPSARIVDAGVSLPFPAAMISQRMSPLYAVKPDAAVVDSGKDKEEFKKMAERSMQKALEIDPGDLGSISGDRKVSKLQEEDEEEGDTPRT